MTGEYITFADLRPGSAAEFAAGLELSDKLVGDDALITSAIARVSQRFDDLTNDHFSTQTTTTLTLQGNGTRLLDLPRRCTAATTVSIVNSVGTTTAQASTVYRLHSSLDAAGAVRTSPGSLDWLEMIPGQYLAGASWGSSNVWPDEPNSVTVLGTFGWTVTPADVKRAIAALVFDHFHPVADTLRRTVAWSAGDASFSRAVSTPTGLPDVDAIIANYARGVPVSIA